MSLVKWKFKTNMDTSSDEDSDSFSSYLGASNTLISNINYVNNKNYKIQNVAQKIINRETFGLFKGQKKSKSEKIFQKIPPRLRFCLMDIVPPTYLKSHVFMGFTQCGQFLLSFTFNRTYSSQQLSFRLHFLSWVPGKMAHTVHSVPLFDDDGVDNELAVSMAQWKHNPNLLVVYGIPELSTERSYLSIIGVPRLGCQKCSTKSNQEDDISECYGKRCLEHNFAVHTKFYCTSESSMCEPVVQLAYSNQIIIYTDFIHILEIDKINSEDNESVIIEERNTQEPANTNVCEDTNSVVVMEDIKPTLAEVAAPNQPSQTVVQRILADFSDLEMETCSTGKPVQLPNVMGQELCIQASSVSSQIYNEEWEATSPSLRTLISPPLRSPRRRPAEGMSRFNETHRIIADKTYEFVEETETKCEKLSIFRRRRLADKKYEFSEDNTENIVPFRVLRSNRKYYIGSTNKVLPRRPKSPMNPETVVLRVHNQIATPAPITVPSPSISLSAKCGNISLTEREQPSESEYRVTAMLDDGSLKTVAVHDNTSKTLSDCVVHPHDPHLVHSGNSKCSKYFTRYFVESDDDITSIITDSEDDCIYGYHVALPLTAHGARYAPLQAIGMSAWDKLRHSQAEGAVPPLPALTLRATQRSLDIELLCNEVCVRLCRLNGKKFIYCFDWGCHVVDVCPSSGCLCGLCAMWVWASEESGGEVGAGSSKQQKCEACRDLTAGCMLHRLQYAAECLFEWDLETGVYKTQYVSFREDSTQDANRVSGTDRARKLAMALGSISTPLGSENRLLTTLTGMCQSLKRLTDLDHCIEITKRHPDSSDSESETEVEPDDESDMD